MQGEEGCQTRRCLCSGKITFVGNAAILDSLRDNLHENVRFQRRRQRRLLRYPVRQNSSSTATRARILSLAGRGGQVLYGKEDCRVGTLFPTRLSPTPNICVLSIRGRNGKLAPERNKRCRLLAHCASFPRWNCRFDPHWFPIAA